MLLNQKKTTKSRKGFTIIELLVVLAIIGILAAIATPLAIGVIDKGKAKETLIRMKEFESAVNTYNSENGRLPYAGDTYPSDEELDENSLAAVLNILLNKSDDNAANRKYLSMPDAKSGNNGIVFTDDTKTTAESMTDGWGNQFSVSIDYDLDGEISSSTGTIENKTVILISGGIDSLIDGEDDINSW